MRLLPRAVSAQVRDIQAKIRLRNAERAVASFQGRRGGRPHGLPGEMIVSLASYRPRFATLSKTLRSLLAQTVRADRTILWVPEEDRPELPADVLSLEERGLEIRTSRNLRSYGKIIPALENWPDAYIVTADDDLYYEPTWLETLVGGAVPGEHVIVCRRAHRPKQNGSGFEPYAEWDWDVVTNGEVRDDLFPTGGAGALYPPRSLSPDVLDEATFMSICPTADDIWLYWMGRRAGSKVRQVGGGFAQVTWPGSQEESLLSVNVQGGNDAQLRAVVSKFN